MKFNTVEEALPQAGKYYIKSDKMTILDYSNSFSQLIAKWADAEDERKKLITVDKGRFYHYKDDIGLFPTEEDKIYVSEDEFEHYKEVRKAHSFRCGMDSTILILL